MQEGKVSGTGFFRATKARNAEEAIGHSEGLVTVLRLTQADLKPAEAALAIAKNFFAAHQYSRAIEAARRAESLAITLDERHTVYQKAATALRSRIASMKKLGLPTRSLELAFGQGEEKALAGTWENSILVPNYIEARVMIEAAEKEGRILQEKSERASNAIFMAELAIEALANAGDTTDGERFAEGATAGLERFLHDATRELAIGNADAATKTATDLEANATRLRNAYRDAMASLAETDRRLAELRGEGVLTQALEGQIKLASETLARGIIEPGTTMAARLSTEAKQLGDLYRKATTGLNDAEFLYGRLQREGFHSYEADTALRDARRAIREGSYPRAIDYLERALQSFARRTNARASLAKAIEETRTRVRLLQGRGLALLPDIQEVLIRAQREFQHGNFSGSTEDLRIATVLLDKVTQAPAPKK